MIPDPVFIIGTERSGSNLLRLLLNAHPRIAIPHPPHVMRDMAGSAKYYGDLSIPKNMERLAGDMACLVNNHFAPWPFPIEGSELARRATLPTLYGAYVALYELFMRQEGKERWGCKSTFMYKHIEEARSAHGKARFIHLVRDPRDVAVSAGQSIFSRFHPFTQAQLWTEQQTIIEQSAGPDLFRVRYEDLVRDPEVQLKKIMIFLEEDYFSSQLQFFRGKAAGELSALSESWKNCAIPVSAGSVGRYQSCLSVEEIGWIESEAKELMLNYGYSISPSGGVSPSRMQRAQIALLERARMLSTEAKSMVKDKNFSLRWKKKALIQYFKVIRSIEYGRGTRKNANL
jgi:hypothetical protein